MTQLAKRFFNSDYNHYYSPDKTNIELNNWIAELEREGFELFQVTDLHSGGSTNVIYCITMIKYD